MQTKEPSTKVQLLHAVGEKLPRKKKKAVQNYFRTNRKMLVLDEALHLTQARFVDQDKSSQGKGMSVELDINLERESKLSAPNITVIDEGKSFVSTLNQSH